MSSQSGDTRLHCICGQKMRITPAMYGQPGKCVGCRQKVWIPFSEEVAAFGPDIYLDDHPELLRQPGQRHRLGQTMFGERAKEPIPDNAVSTATAEPKKEKEASATDKPADTQPPTDSRIDVPAGAKNTPKPESLRREEPKAADIAREEEETASSTPEKPAMDILEPLRYLASAMYHLDRQSAFTGDTAENIGETRVDPPVDAYRRLVQSAWKRLNRQLRDILLETNHRHASVMEEIGETTLRFRVGETDPETYFTGIARLRRRREYLERLQADLKAWLQTHDVFLAGGPMEIDFTELNLDGLEVALPTPPDESAPVLPALAAELREAFAQQAMAERKAGEWRRIAEERRLPETSLLEGRRATEAALTRARTTIGFLRERLLEAMKDFEADIHAVQTYDRLLIEKNLPPSRGELSAETRAKETQLLALSLDDLRRRRQWARAAATANTAGDLSDGQPTLFRNVTAPIPLRSFAVEAVPALGAALGLILIASLPGPAGLRIILTVAALLLAVITVLSRQTTRGMAYTGLWVVVSLLLGMSAAGFLKSSSALLFSDVLLSLISWAGIGACSWITLKSIPIAKRWLPLAGISGILLFALGAMLFKLPVPESAPSGSIRLPAIAVSSPKAPKPEIPVKDEEKASPISPASPPPPPPRAAAPPENTENIARKTPSTSAVAHPLPLMPENIQKNTALPSEGEEILDEEGENVLSEAVEPLPMQDPVVELRGVLKKEGGSPRFRVTLHLPNGRESRLDIGLGEKVHENWVASEYNVADNKLTISDGQHILILEAGKPVILLPGGGKGA